MFPFFSLYVSFLFKSRIVKAKAVQVLRHLPKSGDYINLFRGRLAPSGVSLVYCKFSLRLKKAKLSPKREKITEEGCLRDEYRENADLSIFQLFFVCMQIVKALNLAKRLLTAFFFLFFFF